MNALEELLSGDVAPSIEDLRSATELTLSILRHDRRIESLDGLEARALAMSLYHTPDVRTLMNTRGSYPKEVYEEELQEVELFTCQVQLDVVDPGSLEDPRVQTMQRELVARGGQMRVSTVPFRVNIYNATFAMVARDFDDTSAGCYAVSEPGLVRSFVRLHARLWRRGARWKGKEARARGTDVDLIDVLGELLGGSTDEAAAQHLHVSLRTYRRRVQELLRQLGADSRFQAGVIAQERHYIELIRDLDVTKETATAPYTDALARVRTGSAGSES